MKNETEKQMPVKQRCLVLPLFKWGGDKYPVIAELRHGFKLVAHKNGPAITDGDRFSTLHQYDDDPEGLKDVKRQAFDKLQEFVWPHLRPMLACPTYGRTTMPCCASFVRMFKPQFAFLVEAGTKLQTVRPKPKRMPKPGDKISLRCWTGKPYRSKQRVLRDAVITRVEEIDIYESAVRVCKTNGRSIRVVEQDREAFARLDGFVSWAEMREWFRVTHGLPFHGVLICWQNATREAGAVAPSLHADVGQEVTP